jgi:hypothetical protein
VIVRSTIPAVLEVLGADIERQESVEQPDVDRERDQRPAGGVAAGKITVLEEVVQGGSGFIAARARVGLA